MGRTGPRARVRLSQLGNQSTMGYGTKPTPLPPTRPASPPQSMVAALNGFAKAAQAMAGLISSVPESVLITTTKINADVPAVECEPEEKPLRAEIFFEDED